MPGRRDREHQLAIFLLQRKVEGGAALRLGGDDLLEAPPRCRVRPKAQEVTTAFGAV